MIRDSVYFQPVGPRHVGFPDEDPVHARWRQSRGPPALWPHDHGGKGGGYFAGVSPEDQTLGPGPQQYLLGNVRL